MADEESFAGPSPVPPSDESIQQARKELEEEEQSENVGEYEYADVPAEEGIEDEALETSLRRYLRLGPGTQAAFVPPSVLLDINSVRHIQRELERFLPLYNFCVSTIDQCDAIHEASGIPYGEFSLADDLAAQWHTNIREPLVISWSKRLGQELKGTRARVRLDHLEGASSTNYPSGRYRDGTVVSFEFAPGLPLKQVTLEELWHFQLNVHLDQPDNITGQQDLTVMHEDPTSSFTPNQSSDFFTPEPSPARPMPMSSLVEPGEFIVPRRLNFSSGSAAHQTQHGQFNVLLGHLHNVPIVTTTANGAGMVHSAGKACMGGNGGARKFMVRRRRQ